MSGEPEFGHDPDLTLEGFRLWVHGRQFPDAQDYWDGNWLNVTARVDDDGATVRATGAIIRNDELGRFAEQLTKLYETVEGAALLECLEPYLSIGVTGNRLGHVEIVVNLTPDHLTQKHRFTFAMDQSYLPSTLDECRKILERYPVRGSP